MTVKLNHTIVAAHDHEKSALFLTELLGLQAPVRLGPFAVVTVGDRLTLDFMKTDGDVASQHYAFLVSEVEFDQIFARIKARNLPYWRIPLSRSATRSTDGTTAVASTSKIPTDICSRS